MNVPVRPKLAERTRRRRATRGGRGGERPEPRTSTLRDDGSISVRRREVGPPQDQALYSCECGFVFAAQVSTSVGCPHCGNVQAW
jgi:hypothetical protein